METDFSEWDLKQAFVTYLEQNEFATAKRRMVDDILGYMRLPSTSRRASEKAEDLLAKLKVSIYLYRPTCATLKIIFVHFRKNHPRLIPPTAHRGKSIPILKQLHKSHIDMTCNLSTQASSSPKYTDSVVNLHSNIKNQSITINQKCNMISDSSDGVREAKRQKT